MDTGSSEFVASTNNKNLIHMRCHVAQQCHLAVVALVSALLFWKASAKMQLCNQPCVIGQQHQASHLVLISHIYG